MKEPIKSILKLIFVGMATTVVRIIGQLSIPAGEQTVLAPSIFAQNGTMPVAFTIYGIFAYSLIAALFLLIRKRTGGNRIWQGLRYGFACCAVWIVYLWEPLPHVAPLDRITYPVAENVVCYNRKTGSFTTLGAARAWSGTTNLYYDKTPDQGGKIRVIEVG